MLKTRKPPQIATAHRPPTACSPTLLQTSVFCICERTSGIKPSRISTGINRDQTGIECLIWAWSFPCSFLVFFWSIFLIPDLLSFLSFARLYFFIALSSLTQFSRTFLSLGALCLAIAIVPRLVRGDLHSPPSPPLNCRLIPALRPRKFPRLIGTSHNIPGLHSSNPHCLKGNYLHSYFFFQSVLHFIGLPVLPCARRPRHLQIAHGRGRVLTNIFSLHTDRGNLTSNTSFIHPLQCRPSRTAQL